MKIIGNSSKDSQYLNRIKAAIKGDKDHPRNNGVQMQAHHIISGEGMKQSGIGKKVEEFGYNINLLPNLVFIPCTLQGACHLEVQLHRGNHTVSQDEYDDDSEPKNYHALISEMIISLRLPLNNECIGRKNSNLDKVVNELNGLSKNILKLIQKKPAEAPLTRIADNFSPGSMHGCGGVDSIGLHKKSNHVRSLEIIVVFNQKSKKMKILPIRKMENIYLKLESEDEKI